MFGQKPEDTHSCGRKSETWEGKTMSVAWQEEDGQQENHRWDQM